MKDTRLNAFIFFVIPLLLLFLAGCQGSTKAGKSNQPTQDNFHIGTQGIVLELLPNSPPAKIYSSDMSALLFNLKVLNKGAYDLSPNDITIILTGFDETILNFDNPIHAFSSRLYGKSLVYPNGGEDFITWQANNMARFTGDEYNPVFMISSCYRYKTIATPSVCIDPNPYTAVSQDKVCSVNQITLTGSQGAPVAVTKIEPTMMPNAQQAMFKIYVSNVGGGTVLTPDGQALGSARLTGTSSTLVSDLIRTCVDKNLHYNDINKVHISVGLGGQGGNYATCTPDIINLNSGTGYSVCRVPFNRAGQSTVGSTANTEKTAYNTQLYIELSYGYTSSITKSVKIVNTEQLDTGFR